MSSSLDTLANDKLKKILYNLTSNKYLGVLIGTVITAIIHSSSATSVILISLLNSHLITLNQATWIILGANIGTTFTGLLIAFDIVWHRFLDEGLLRRLHIREYFAVLV